MQDHAHIHSYSSCATTRVTSTRMLLLVQIVLHFDMMTVTACHHLKIVSNTSMSSPISTWPARWKQSTWKRASSHIVTFHIGLRTQGAKRLVLLLVSRFPKNLNRGKQQKNTPHLYDENSPHPPFVRWKQSQIYPTTSSERSEPYFFWFLAGQPPFVRWN